MVTKLGSLFLEAICLPMSIGIKKNWTKSDGSHNLAPAIKVRQPRTRDRSSATLGSSPRPIFFRSTDQATHSPVLSEVLVLPAVDKW